jgi:hypothetical protein
MGRIGFALSAFLAAFILVQPAGAATVLFTNTAPITVPGCAQNDCSVQGRADPYPSTINVSGFRSPVAGIRVTLRGIEHTAPDDVDALLAPPTGPSVLLMSDACMGAPLTGQTLMFDTSGPPLPATSPCAPAVYAATNYGSPDPFVPPAPASPGVSSLAGLTGAKPNGAWRLFVMDDGISGGVGEITGGWRLELRVPTVAPAPAPVTCAGRPVTIAAGPGEDAIKGTAGRDVVNGMGGADTIKGRGGNDVICGGDGKDRLLGGRGKDVLRGEAGKDKLKGQGGKDKLKGGPGRDICVGGAKRDLAKGCERRKSI